jgi:hypothetical protein
MLRLPGVLPHYEDRLDTRNQLFQPGDRRHSLTPPTVAVTGVPSRIPRSLDPTHFLPKSIRSLTVRSILSVQSGGPLRSREMPDRD